MYLLLDPKCVDAFVVSQYWLTYWGRPLSRRLYIENLSDLSSVQHSFDLSGFSETPCKAPLIIKLFFKCFLYDQLIIISLVDMNLDPGTIVPRRVVE